jgi:hypothetical protein
MQFATLLFYGVSSFFLGQIAIATDGSAVLQSIFDSNGFVIGSSHEPWQTILESFVVVVPLVFAVLAVVSIVRPSGDAPATAAEIRNLIAALERRTTSERPADGPSVTYRRP